MLHTARCKYRTQEIVKKSPSGHYRTTLSGYIFAIKAHIDSQKKLIKHQYLPHMFPPSSLGHPCKFKWVSHLGSLTAQHSSIGRQPHFAVLNRGRHLCSAGWPSRWAMTHISSCYCLCQCWLGDRI